jgi:hypothetical protein
MRVVDPMSGSPLYRPSLKRQRATHYEKVLNCLGHFVPAMRDQPVIAHPDTEAAGDPIQEHRGNDRRPTPKKEGSYGANMKDGKENTMAPIDVPLVPGCCFRWCFFLQIKSSPRRFQV